MAAEGRLVKLLTLVSLKIAPVPRKKEGRAARLAAMMENEDGTPMVQTGEGAEAQSDNAKASMDSARSESMVSPRPNPRDGVAESVV